MDVRDSKDLLAVRFERSLSRQIALITLGVIALLVMLGTLAFAFLSANRVSELKVSLEDMLRNYNEESQLLGKKYADAVSELALVKSQRDNLSRQLASVKQELTEMRLELQSGRATSEREMSNLKRMYTNAAEKYASLERKSKQAEALAAQLEAFKDETAFKMQQYEKTINELHQKIQQLKERKLPAVTKSRIAVSGRIIPSMTGTPAPTPAESLSPEDIKKKKERELDDL